MFLVQKRDSIQFLYVCVVVPARSNLELETIWSIKFNNKIEY